jgi:hypothetical protein
MQDNFNMYNWKVNKIKESLEETEFTKQYDDNPKLKGGQKDLPDALQAKILNKEGKYQFPGYQCPECGCEIEENINEADMFVTGGSINPELVQKVERFVKGVAKYYGYSVDDAFYAIMAILKGGIRK